MTAPDPEGEGAAAVMLLALEDAGLTPKDVDYINVHGTSTGLGDVAEPKAIQRAFGEHAYELNISSTKSMTGHLLPVPPRCLRSDRLCSGCEKQHCTPYH